MATKAATRSMTTSTTMKQAAVVPRRPRNITGSIFRRFLKYSLSPRLYPIRINGHWPTKATTGTGLKNKSTNEIISEDKSEGINDDLNNTDNIGHDEVTDNEDGNDNKKDHDHDNDDNN